MDADTNKKVLQTWDTYKDSVWTYIYYKTEHNYEDSNDILQEVWCRFSKCFMSKPFPERGVNCAYLITIAKRILIDRGRRATLEIPIIEIYKAKRKSASCVTPLEKTIQSEDGERLMNALLKLSQNAKSAIISKYWYGKKNKEIGEEIGITELQACRLVQNSVKTLRELLSKGEKADGTG